MQFQFAPGAIPDEASADAVAVIRAMLARDTDALQAIFNTVEPAQLAVAACNLVILTHRVVTGDDAAIDALMADMQRQWLDIQARDQAPGGPG